MKRRLVIVLLALTALLCVAGLVVGGSIGWRHLRLRQARIEWKEQAIPEVRKQAEDAAWVARESAMLRGEDGNPEIIAAPWLSRRMVLMANGEWLVYRSHCHKEEPRHVRDICIARASDGKWYYSTCHFCVGMIALLMMQDDMEDPQPADLGFFLRRYQFREFDGRSNECLKETGTLPDRG